MPATPAADPTKARRNLLRLARDYAAAMLHRCAQVNADTAFLNITVRFPRYTERMDSFEIAAQKGFGVSGYRSFGDDGLRPDDIREINVIIAKNECRQSNVLSAIRPLKGAALVDSVCGGARMARTKVSRW
jgi:hypothetical protein